MVGGSDTQMNAEGGRVCSAAFHFEMVDRVIRLVAAFDELLDHLGAKGRQIVRLA